MELETTCNCWKLNSWLFIIIPRQGWNDRKYWPSHGQVVDGDLAQVLALVHDEEAAEWDASLLVQHTVVARDAVRLVADDRDVHGAQATCRTGSSLVNTIHKPCCFGQQG